MSTWAKRMHTIGTVVTSCGYSEPYPYHRLEKVKFGVSLEEVCRNDIPAPLLVLILKLNKEAPYKRDVFRAPGHQGNVKKLIHFLEVGRLVNIDNFSVYTIASVLKKFLRKLPDGIFGSDKEERLFNIIEIENDDHKRQEMKSLLETLPVTTQQVLVLLFGTFRMMALQADSCQSGMTSEALGVSVAPSFFQSCVSDGKHARMEDVNRFKVATKIMQFMIDQFGVSDLFGRHNYEFYARITGRILKVEKNWIFHFHCAADSSISRKEAAGLQFEALRWGLRLNLEDHPGSLQETSARLSVSLGENGLCQVHERQTARMKTRSEWFLSQHCRLPSVDVDTPPVLRPHQHTQCLASVSEGESSPPNKAPLLVRRSSSKRGKENDKGSAKRAHTPSNTCHVSTTYKPRI